MKIAEAPSVAVNRVATYKELDTDLLKHAAFATLEDIDLTVLTNCMAPEAALKEHCGDKAESSSSASSLSEFSEDETKDMEL